MFQKIVVITAIVILLIALTVIGLSLSGAGQGGATSWPPVIGDCPDYWVDLEGTGSACLNVHNLGTCNLTNDKKIYDDMPNTNSVGNTLSEHADVNLAQCKSLCSTSGLCFGTAYNNATQQCYLKSEDVMNAEKQTDKDYTLSLKNKDGMHADVMDFTTAGFTGNNGLCAKHMWANNCGIVWDGINSGNSTNPCNGEAYSD